MPARDPFYKTRAAEIAANIVKSELEPFMGNVFVSIDSNCVGEVLATTRAGTLLVLVWDVEHQCIRTIDQAQVPGQDQVQHVVLAA